MPQPVKLRASLQQDASYLARLKVALEGDDRPPDWKKRVFPVIDSLRVLLLEREAVEIADRAKKVKEKKRD
jgi:hypothetical protein